MTPGAPPISAQRAIDLLNASHRHAKTLDGRRVHFHVERTDLGDLECRLALLAPGKHGGILDARRWRLAGLRFDHLPEGAFVAFTECLRRSAGAFAWDATFPDSFPPWWLLRDPSLVTADDFARALDHATPPQPPAVEPVEVSDFGMMFASRRHAGAPIERVDVGEVTLSSGRLVVRDPFLRASPGLETGAPPGAYPVDLLLARFAAPGTRVIAARVTLLPTPAVRWRSAEAWRIEAGLVAFMGEDTSARLDEHLEARKGNYYSEVLAPALEPRGKAWFLYRLDARHAAAIVRGRTGGGAYRALTGLDEEGRTVSIVIDFDVLCQSDPRREAPSLPRAVRPTRSGAVMALRGAERA